MKTKIICPDCLGDMEEPAIGQNGKQIKLGCFKTEEDAARAYNKAAIKIHGEFARLNQIT